MGEIVTFYSYKGGTGRTMTLCNIATLLAQWKYKVLIVDWDLEAPGIEHFFKSFMDWDQLPYTKGVIDLIAERLDSNPSETDWRDIKVKVPIIEGEAYLDILLAGQKGEGYSEKLRALDIPTFYSQKNGGRFIESLRNEWKKEYDYIFIDSRTGLTDMGGICTIQLPDVLVLMFTATEQSFKGILDISQKVEKAQQNFIGDRLRLVSIPILSRYDSQVEIDRSQDWVNRVAKELHVIYDNWLPTSIDPFRMLLEGTKIPYIPYYSFGEDLAVLKHGTTDPTGLGYACENLAALIANNLESVKSLLDDRDFFVYTASRRNASSLSSVVIFYNHKDEEWKDELTKHLQVLDMKGLLDFWDDRDIKEEDWFNEIEVSLDRANVVLFLISANLLSGDFLINVEFQRLIQRRINVGMRVFPIIITPCAWKQIPWFTELEIWPKNGTPLSKMNQKKIDENLLKIAQLIPKPLNKISAEKKKVGLPTPKRAAKTIEDIQKYEDTVFISYSHDSQEHVERALALANRLRQDGIDSIIDQYVISPAEGWAKWMEKQLNDARFVIVICTKNYFQRIEGHLGKQRGLGVRWESTLTYQYIYNNDSVKIRFIPIIFDSYEIEYIPALLRDITYYCLDTEEGYEALYRRLTNQPAVLKPGLGTVMKLPKKDRSLDIFRTRLSDGNISLYRLPVTTGGLFGREKELKFLDEAWDDVNTHIVTLVAWGGMGKTTLVNGWLNEMQKQEYRNAQRVFGWSFYSQGAEEGKQSSADEFLHETLEWFGDTDPKAGANVEKGRRLARLVQKQKTLLILDGLEPLQYPPGDVHGFDGKLKDAGMAAFVKELASTYLGGDGTEGYGLCVITTREKITDLAHKTGHAVKEVMLESLSDEAGVQLLRSLGVTTGTDADVTAAVKEYGGHALALTLLGNYIKRKYKGDIRKCDKISRLTKERIKGGHARRVMEAYERWLGESVERDILYIMGLFDRPVEPGAIGSLKSAPAIPGVTDHLVELSEEDWEEALSNLRTARLLGEENPQKLGTLDCHPLVREHFGERLREKNPGGWKAAHERLYRYFKALPEKELPDTLAEMEPLFAAMAHGCKAGLHQEALDEVYWKRILRKDEFFCTKKLGAFGSDLAAVSHFFDVPWRQPAAGLTEADKALVLSWAAFRLRAVGRLREAVQPMKAGLEMGIQQDDWKGAAQDASNLSELMLTLGEVTAAVDYGRRGVTHADRSKDEFMMEVTRTILADALHQSGQWEEAEKWFREAEAMQKKRQPEFPFLYSLQGYEFCDLLLTQGATNEVMERAEKALEIAKRNNWLLDISLDNLTLGRAWMIRETHENSGDFSRAMAFLETAVTGLREANHQEFLARGLLARAECYRRMGAFSKARDDLDEAEEIAETGDMKLHLCALHLEAAKLCRDEGNETKANQHAQTAEKLIEETKYYRKKRIINNAEWLMDNQ